MAFKKTLAHRLFNISKISNPTLTNCRLPSSSSAAQVLIPPNPAKFNPDPDPDDNWISRRFLQWRRIYQSAVSSPELRSPPRGQKLLEKLRGMDIARDRLRLEGLSPPATRSEPAEVKLLTVEDARKLLRATLVETVKSKLREIQKTYISFAEFVEICVDSCSNRDQGQELAKTLDDSGAVIVLGNVVFLKPDQVVKAIQGLMPVPVAHPNDPRTKELEEMEKQKAAIDKKAESLVFRELWGGLGYLVVQTAVFMRLTFWELTWDVMEPICFYVTSLYFMAGYAFFLRTSKEPSFEGFYQSRFSAKQKRLMQIHNFDLGRYNELRRACYPYSSSSSSSSSSSELALSPFNSERTEFGGSNDRCTTKTHN